MPTKPAMKSSSTESANQTSQSLITRAKAKEPAAWERIVQLYSPMVYYWCRESGLPEPDVCDVFQEVFHTLARNLTKFQPQENGTFRGWLRTIARNKLNDHFRKSGREPRPIGGTEALHRLEQFPAGSFPAGSFAADQRQPTSSCDHSKLDRSEKPEESKIRQVLLVEVLAIVRPQFTEKSWRAFWMVVIDGRSTSDVAMDLSMRPGAVRVAKSRVLKRLRAEMGDATD